MTRIRGLTQQDREFFRLVSAAAFSNPFGEERDELDHKIGETVKGASREEVLNRAVRRVIERVAALEAIGKAELDAYAGDDYDLMIRVFLFEVFHRFMGDFDRLILDQVESQDTPCSVPFAREALGLLNRRGFNREDALRTFAFFYQMRRGFFFIDRGLVGRSRCMTTLRHHLWDHVFTHNTSWYGYYLWDRMEDFSTLLLGETGTGKGTAAAAIGRSGFIPFDEKSGCFTESFTENFLAINLSQYPESLIESELFGHRRGAFTGAIDHHDGIFSRCPSHGSIFLDEIGDIAVPIQIKLLQVLQERTFAKVGSHEKLRFRGRVIAATNRPLNELLKQGRFRSDLYYRLCSSTIQVPTLQQRLAEDPDELDLLLSHIVVRLTGTDVPEMVATVREVIARNLQPGYAWPGNVRELEQAARSVLLTRSYQGGSAGGTELGDRMMAALDAGTLDAKELLSLYCKLLYERFGSYEEVAKRTKLDWRTVKKHLRESGGQEAPRSAMTSVKE